eukprot:1157415-Pelagomonas_calceolata.AAC.5
MQNYLSAKCLACSVQQRTTHPQPPSLNQHHTGRSESDIWLAPAPQTKSTSSTSQSRSSPLSSCYAQILACTHPIRILTSPASQSNQDQASQPECNIWLLPAPLRLTVPPRSPSPGRPDSGPPERKIQLVRIQLTLHSIPSTSFQQRVVAIDKVTAKLF